MARLRPRTAAPVPGPARWSFKSYQIHERTGPRGRRYDIRTPAKELVASCRSRRGSHSITFYADEKGKQELMRLVPKSVRQYAAAFDAIDGVSGRPIGEFRKKVYRPIRKSEWFIYNPEGEPVGMVTDAAPRPTLLRRFLPVALLGTKTYQLHWGQAIAGTISRTNLWPLVDRTQLDLSLDKRDEIDRRLALGLTVLMRDEEKNGRWPLTPGRAAARRP